MSWFDVRVFGPSVRSLRYLLDRLWCGGPDTALRDLLSRAPILESRNFRAVGSVPSLRDALGQRVEQVTKLRVELAQQSAQLRELLLLRVSEDDGRTYRTRQLTVGDGWRPLTESKPWRTTKSSPTASGP